MGMWSRPVTASNLEALKCRPIVIASHPRSGTHLTIDLLRRQFKACGSWKWPGENPSRLYLSLEALYQSFSRTPISECKALTILRRVSRPLVKTHLVFSEAPTGPTTAKDQLGLHWIKWLTKQAVLLYVYRDGRDMMCSLHRWRQRSEPRARVGISDFMRQTQNGMSRPRFWAHHVRQWLAQPGVVPVRYDHVVRQTDDVLRQLAGVLDLEPRWVEPRLPQRVGGVWQGRLNWLVRMRPPATTMLGRWQGKEPLKWRQAFAEADRAFFHQEAGDLLVELGYESSDAWVTGTYEKATT